MRAPFARPYLATFFYILAGLSVIFAMIAGASFAIGGSWALGQAFAGFATAYGVVIFVVVIIQAATFTAIGYGIELLAKIEWNTRPNTDEMGYVVEPASISTPSDKQYYLSEKGRVTGPLNAAELLALYRDGRISIAAQISVEENGQRRLLKNLSEIGL